MANAPTLIGILRGVEANKAVKRVAKLTAGEGVMLDRAPNNPYDSNAVRVLDVGGKMLGHIDRDTAKILSRHMDQGVIFLATVKEPPIVARLPGIVGIKKDSCLIRCVPLPPLLKKTDVPVWIGVDNGKVHS